MLNHEDSFDAGSECSLPGSPRSRVPSPSMERLDRLVRSGGFRGKEPEMFILLLQIEQMLYLQEELCFVQISAGSWTPHFSKVKSISQH